MLFLQDVYVKCDVCKGTRYNRETLEVKYKGLSIADVLELTVDEAVEHFKDIPRIVNKLKVIQEAGLGYIGWTACAYSERGRGPEGQACH